MNSRYTIVVSPIRLRIFRNHEEYLQLYFKSKIIIKLIVIGAHEFYYAIKNALIGIR